MSFGRVDQSGYNIISGYYSPTLELSNETGSNLKVVARKDRFSFISQNSLPEEQQILYNSLVEMASNGNTCWVWKKHIINAFKDSDDIHSCSFVPTNPTKSQTLFLRKDPGVDSLEAMFQEMTVSHSFRPPFISYQGPIEAKVDGDPDYWIFELRKVDEVIPSSCSETLSKKLRYIIGCFVCDNESKEITLGFMVNGKEVVLTWSK